MLRKIFSVLVLVIFLTNSASNVFALSVEASVPDISYQMSSSKERIKKLKNWYKYLPQLTRLGQFVNKQTDLNILTKIKLKLEEKMELTLWKDELTYELLNYISLLVQKRISELEEIENKDIVKQVANSTLTDDEISKVNAEIVKLQINLLDSSKSFVDNIISEFKKSLNVEKTGNLKLTVEWSWAMLWSWKWELNIKDMKSKAAGFDSELEAQVDLLVEASMVWWKDLKTQFSSFINFINKDGNMYLLLQKLNYSWIEDFDYSWEYSRLLDKIKELWESNTYLKIEDKQSAMLLEMIKNFNINNIYGEANKVLQKPMLKPYKKDGDKYLLAPTKDFCDSIKYINYKMNSYWSSSCTDEEYNKMLRSTVGSWNLYIIIDWEDKHLWYTSTQYGVKGYLKIYNSEKKVEKFLLYTELTAWKNKWDVVNLTYINWKKLDFIVTSVHENESVNLSFKSSLTTDNTFSEIDHVWNFLSNWEWFNSFFKLENKKFNWEFVLVSKETTEFVWKISWEMNANNWLSAFDLNINSTEKADQYNYDWETWESSYVPTVKEFDLDYSLKSELISGTATYKENEKEMFSIKSNWKYRKWYFELNNSINIMDSYNEDTIKWNLNAKFFWNLEDNKFELYIDVNSKNWVVKINLVTDSKLEYRDDLKINAPTNYKDINDLTWANEIEVQDSPEAQVPEFFE